jgi:hypothetical protein
METPFEQEIAKGIARRIAKGIAIAIAAIIGITIFVFLGGKIVQWLWNWLLPPLFGFPAVTYWQALGLLALCRILLGNIGGRGGPRKSRMTLEEREGLRRRMRDRCGSPPAATMADHAEKPVQ